MVRVVEDIRWEAARVQRVVGTPLDMARHHDEPIEESLQPHRRRDEPHDGPHEDELPDAYFRRMPILLSDL